MEEGATAEDRRYGCYTQLARRLRVSNTALSIYLVHAIATGLAAGHRPLRLVLVSSVYFAIVTHVKLTGETCHFGNVFLLIRVSEHLFSLIYLVYVCLLCYFLVSLKVLGRQENGETQSTPGQTKFFVWSGHTGLATTAVVAANHLKM